MKKYSWLVSVEDYEPLIGIETVERIIRKAQHLRRVPKYAIWEYAATDRW